jgi:hypothetical protein
MLKAKYPGERVHMDVSGPFTTTLGGHRYWIILKTNTLACHGITLSPVRTGYMK